MANGPEGPGWREGGGPVTLGGLVGDGPWGRRQMELMRLRYVVHMRCLGFPDNRLVLELA